MRQISRYKIAIAAGGTGGHLFPAKTFASQLSQQGVDVFFGGHNLSLNPFFQGRCQFRSVDIPSAPLTEPFSFVTTACCRGVTKAIGLLRHEQPSLVVGFGSYHAFPMLAAASILRIPIVLFEANCWLGKVNRLFRPFAKKIAYQLPPTKHDRKAVMVSRLPWGASPPKIDQKQARRAYGLSETVPTFLVFGGSQGANVLNQRIPAILNRLEGSFQVIHCTGRNQTAIPYTIPCVIKEFESEMALAYAAADFVIARSGASTVAELMLFEKPALLIPYANAADDHQTKNANFLSDSVLGAKLCVESGDVKAAVSALVQDASTMVEAICAWKAKETTTKDLAAWICSDFISSV
ncbi:MAG: hypothetical protein RL235_1142 [Chlamydiota bacterium]